MAKGTIILLHFLTWLICSVTWFLSAEWVTNFIYPGIGGVEQWLSVCFGGMTLISLVVILSLSIRLIRRRR